MPKIQSRSSGAAVRMAAVLAFAGVLFFARLGERALWSEEVRWLQIPREMQASGDWLWPTINGQSYYDKPLLSYWLVLLSSYATGTLDEESARLPSAICAVLAVALLMSIARRLYGETVALWAGLILATSFSFVFFARTASTDIETVAGLLAALWLLLKFEERPAGEWMVALWLVMAVTSLTKGLLGFALPTLVIAPYAWLRTRDAALNWAGRAAQSQRWLLQRASLVAIPLAAAVYLTPFTLSILTHGSSEGLAMVYRENIRRFFDPVNHRGPIYLYGYVIFLLAAPWSLLLPAALVHAHSSGQKAGRFALAYFWALFIFFTLSASRRSYYLLPILPATALLIAQLLCERESWRPWTARLANGALMALTVATAPAISAFFGLQAFLPAPWDQLPAPPSAWVFAISWLVSVSLIVWAWMERRRMAWAFTGVACAFMIYLYLAALPAVESYRTQKPFAEAVKRELPTDLGGLALYRTREIVGNLNPPAPVAEYRTPAELTEAMASQRHCWLIIRRRDFAELELPGTVVVAETVHPWEDDGQAANKLLLIELNRPLE